MNRILVNSAIIILTPNKLKLGISKILYSFNRQEMLSFFCISVQVFHQAQQI